MKGNLVSIKGLKNIKLKFKKKPYQAKLLHHERKHSKIFFLNKKGNLVRVKRLKKNKSKFKKTKKKKTYQAKLLRH